MYGGQDPYIALVDGHYYMAAAASGEQSLVVFKSDSLTDRGVSRTVYHAPKTGPYSHELWAPEIHHIDDQWYIYTCADNGDNANHQLIVLEADSDDPLGKYHQTAVLKTPGWAIDETVFRAANGKLYCLWSGWPEGVDPDSTQHIFVSEMKSPTELTGPAVDISGKMYPWETIGRPAGLNEGPQVLMRDGRLFVIYACSGSWTADYCLGLMECADGEVMNPNSWIKQPNPVFAKSGNVYGPGHGCVVKSIDGSEDWLVYHSSMDAGGSWNRSISMKRFDWSDDGTPNFGIPPKWGQVLDAPAGEPELSAGTSIEETFKNLDRWESICFFRSNTVELIQGKLIVRGTLDPRYHDKLVLRKLRYDDFELTVNSTVLNGDGTLGILLRGNNCAVGENRFRGYVVQLTATGRLELGKCDGQHYEKLASKEIEFGKKHQQTLRIVARGANLSVFLGNAPTPNLEATDTSYKSGQLGVMAAGIDATFKNFRVVPLK